MMGQTNEKKVDKLIDKAELAFEKSDFDEAIAILEKALELVPEPRSESYLSLRIYSAIGDAFFLSENFKAALDYFQLAFNCYGGLTNPFVVLRLGECHYYLGDHVTASNHIISSFMLEGEELFEDEPQEIRDFLEKVKNSSSSADFAKGGKPMQGELAEMPEDLFVRWPRNRDKQALDKDLFETIRKLGYKGLGPNGGECKYFEEAWEMIPEPKLKWDIAVLIARELCSSAFERKNFAEARKWLEVYLQTPYTDIDGSPFELGGAIFFELGDQETALQFFSHLEKNWGRRGFPSDKKYLNFYKAQKELRK